MKKKSAVVALLLILALVVLLAGLFYEPLAYVRASVNRFAPYDDSPNAGPQSYTLVRHKRYSWLPGPRSISESISESEFEVLLEVHLEPRWSTDPKTGRSLMVVPRMTHGHDDDGTVYSYDLPRE